MLFILLKSAGMAGDVDTAESLLSVASSEGHAVGIHHYSAAISASIKAKVSVVVRWRGVILIRIRDDCVT